MSFPHHGLYLERWGGAILMYPQIYAGQFGNKLVKKTKLKYVPDIYEARAKGPG